MLSYNYEIRHTWTDWHFQSLCRSEVFSDRDYWKYDRINIYENIFLEELNLDKIFKKLDKKYLKICIYAAITVLITGGIAMLFLLSGPFWSKLWAISAAVFTSCNPKSFPPVILIITAFAPSIEVSSNGL